MSLFDPPTLAHTKRDSANAGRMTGSLFFCSWTSQTYRFWLNARGPEAREAGWEVGLGPGARVCGTFGSLVS